MSGDREVARRLLVTEFTSRTRSVIVGVHESRDCFQSVELVFSSISGTAHNCKVVELICSGNLKLACVLARLPCMPWLVGELERRKFGALTGIGAERQELTYSGGQPAKPDSLKMIPATVEGESTARARGGHGLRP